jgi:SNF2 family DNA or RNA helicase
MVTEPIPEAPKELLKKDALLKLLKENPSGKFLIFSRYDNPFTQISEEITQMNIRVKELKGNKDVIQAALTQFEKGKLQCLLLNSTVMGAGLTITAATHVILLHAMNIEEEKQILGRAYRMGRKEPLNVYRLVHADEIENLN